MHIVFQPEDAVTLAKSFELDETLRSEIGIIKDDFAVGPLGDIYNEEGIEARKQWWRNVLAGTEHANRVDSGEVDDAKTIKDIKELLKTVEEETLWIWIAPNKHDVASYYWLVAQLQEFLGRVYVLSLNNLPFINEKGNIFYPVHLFEIPPKEFLKAKKLARLITASEFEIDTDEWSRICNDSKAIRLLEGAKKLSTHREDFYDNYILEFISADWQKVNKVVHQFLIKSKHTTGDAYMLWRLQEMADNGKIEVNGEAKSRKEVEIRLKPGVAVEG